MEVIAKIEVANKSRIDKALVTGGDYSRADAQRLIKQGSVLVGDIKVRKASFVVQAGATIIVTALLPKPMAAQPENIPLAIVFEDEHLLVVNKPSGLVVHPAPGHPDHTLVNGLLYHLRNLSDLNGPIRPGIVHRIDKDTSGLLIVAKTNEAHQRLAEMLKARTIKRTYLAWVTGQLQHRVYHLDLPIGRNPHHRQKMAVVRENSKAAVTHVYVEKIVGDKTLIKCELETGRTHQIRVHLAHIGHPLIGDPIYGKKSGAGFGQHLHATQLTFTHPITNEKLDFKVAPPAQFDQF